MKNLIPTALTALMFATGISNAALAGGNAGASLGSCYDHVVEACNKTNRPQLCIKNGMKACDSLHSGGKPSSSSRPNGFKAADANNVVKPGQGRPSNKKRSR